MKLHLLCVGRLSEAYLKEGCQEFASRLNRYLPLVIDEQKEHKTGNKPDLPRILENEGQRLLERIPAGAFVIVLDERGRTFKTHQLADRLNRHMIEGRRCWALLIGGPHGLSDAIRERADLLLSLTPLTLTHQMARLLLLEQLYRCCTIIRNEPYHH